MSRLAVVLLVFLLALPARAVDYTLTITAANGTVYTDPSAPSLSFPAGTVVRLIPIPAVGYSFRNWSGDISSKRLVGLVRMDSDKSITANFGAWTAPLGIPTPPFGITETYRMYDTVGNRSGSLTYHVSPLGGYYTHYVDNTDPNATDSSTSSGVSNFFETSNKGTVAKPRKTIPSTVPEGSVVEIHGGPYHYGYTSGHWTWCSVIGVGSASKPVFIRGSVSEPPVFHQMQLRTSGCSFCIIENLDLNDSTIGDTTSPTTTNHLCYRHLEVHGGPECYNTAICPGSGSYIVIYGNYIHDNGNCNAAHENDFEGVQCTTHSHHIWILDNHAHGNAGDFFQVCSSNYWDPISDTFARYIYVGRNVSHAQGEGGIAMKSVRDMIVSENALYDCTIPPWNGGEGIPINVSTDYNHENVWILNNVVFDCLGGIKARGDCTILGNIIFDCTSGIISYNSWDDTHQMYHDWHVTILNNTIATTNKCLSFGSSGDHITTDLIGNILTNTTSDDLICILSATAAGNSTMDYNLLYSSAGSARISWGKGGYSAYEDLSTFQKRTGQGSHAIESDPKFISADANNFHLQATSSAIDAGTSAGVVQEVYDRFQQVYGIDIRKDMEERARSQGSAWDIGAYEYVLSAVGNLSVSGTSRNSVTLAWTVPGQQGVTGTPARYDIRYAGSSITETNWDAATQVQGEPVAGSFGTQQSFTITGLNPGATYYFGIKVLDDAGHSSSLSNVVPGTTATSGNHAPVLNLGDRSAVEMLELQFTVSATDADTGDTLSYSAPSVPSGAVFSPATRTFTWTPTVAQIGIHHATFQVTDGHVTVSDTIAIAVVSGSNHPPVLETIGDKSVNENTLLSFSVRATDIDGQAITYSASDLPSGADFTGQTFTWTPTFDQAGDYHVTFIASDGLTQDSETITISVANVNRAPVLAAIGNRQVNENFPLSFSISATDPDGGTPSYSATGLPSGANFLNGVFGWTPSFTQAGTYSVTFAASDGDLSDTEQITITVANVSDQTAPAVADVYPLADAIQVPINSLIALTVSDGGWGVDANTVTIQVEGQLVYSGNQAEYQSAHGICRRTGTKASYTYRFFPDHIFNYEQEVSVRVMASDLANNAMAPYSYEFLTEMRSFGRNQPVSSSGDSSGHSAVATDSQGNLWAAWHAGQVDARDIYVAKRGSQGQQWDTPLRLTNLGSDQCSPAIAIGPGDTLYVTWQDNRRGNWDIYVSGSADGSTWWDPVRITDSNDNQTNPVIAADYAAPSHVYVAWEDDGVGNQDIYLASSNTSFASKTIMRVTTNPADQTEPALAVGSDNTVYLVWTDQRNGSADIYGSSSSASSWANVPIVTGPSNQSNPAIAVEPGTSTLHVLWVDDAAGNLDVVHGVSNGLPLPGNPISGTIIVDDDTDRDADQSAPAIAAAKDHGNNTHVYACWQDNRSVGSAHDSDLYFVEVRSGASGTNILVGDDGTNSNQSDPALGCDEYGQPAIVWTDSRDSAPRVYSACSTYFNPVALASALIARSEGGRVGVDPASINDDGDVSIQVPANECDCDVAVSISEIQNLPKFTALCIAGYEIGPSGVQFSFPATVTIPYTGSGSGRATPYWYDAQTGTLSQQGMTEITNRTLANGVSVVSFKTTHLTAFYVLESPLPAGGVDGGGGCALSHSHEGSIAGYLLPYAALASFMLILKWRDRRYKGT